MGAKSTMVARGEALRREPWQRGAGRAKIKAGHRDQATTWPSSPAHRVQPIESSPSSLFNPICRLRRRMTFEDWKIKSEQKAKREQERRELETQFNAEIIRRYRAGQLKEEIVASLGISNTLFNRVIRSAQRVG
jgi:hypothetical protein